MKLYDLLQLSVCLFSALAGGFWLQSATNKLPRAASNHRSEATVSFPNALTSQSRWGAAAATCAGVAAFCQSVAVLLPYS